MALWQRRVLCGDSTSADEVVWRPDESQTVTHGHRSAPTEYKLDSEWREGAAIVPDLNRVSDPFQGWIWTGDLAALKEQTC